MMICCVFSASGNLARPFEALLDTLQAGLSVFFRVLDRICRLREARQGHTSVPAGATRPPTQWQIGSVDFPYLLWSVFKPLFVSFPYVSELCEFGKIEFLCRRELDFEGPGLLKISIFLPLTSS